MFNEIVGYQKGDVVFRISACLHPHDYPNSLNVYLVKKVPGEWKSFSLNELLKVIGKNGIDTYEQFLVEPQSKIERTISSLKEICESLLASEVYLKIK